MPYIIDMIFRNIETTGLYHVYNRGTLSMNIFLDHSDYHKFMYKLQEYKDHCGLKIYAYCLMPNHFHIIIEEIGEQIKPHMSNISYFMQLLTTSYSKHFGLKYNHSGRVMQGKFKCKLIDSDNYYLQLKEYILKNPERAGLVNSYNQWPYQYYITHPSIEQPTFHVG